jgi:hypothetical protein
VRLGGVTITRGDLTSPGPLQKGVYSLTRRSEVCFRAQTGKHLLSSRLTGFDPKRASQTILVSASFSFLRLSRLAACARLQLRRSFEAIDCQRFRGNLRALSHVCHAGLVYVGAISSNTSVIARILSMRLLDTLSDGRVSSRHVLGRDHRCECSDRKSNQKCKGKLVCVPHDSALSVTSISRRAIYFVF